MKNNLLFSQTTALSKTLGKRLAMVLTMLLIVGIGQAWGTDATISSFTSISGKFGDVSYNSYKGGGTSNPAANSGAIRLYQNAKGNTGGYIVLSVPDGYTITSATIKSTMATTTGYYIDSPPGATTPAKANFEVSNKSLSANTAYTISGLSTQYITFACFGTSSSSRLYVSYLSVTYQSAAAQTYNVTLSRNGVTETISDVKEGTALDDIAGTGDQGGCSPEWVFEGWSKNQRSAQNNTAVMDLVTTVDGAGPYYAVYSHTAEGGGGSTTVAMSSFSAVSGNVNNDANVSYEAAKGTAGTAPAVNDSQIRIYQNGGTLTITGNNEKKLTSITIGSAMATTVSYIVDSGTESSNKSISANGKFTLNNIEASSVLFTCKGTDKNSRLYLNYLSVTYLGGNTVYYTTSPECSTETSQLATPKVTLTYDCTSATITWDAITNASGYWYQIKKSSDDDAGISSVNTTYTHDDLEQGTSYTWSVKAIGDGTTYLTSEIATGTFTTGYTITYETNGGSAVENACGTNLPSPLPTTTQDGYNFLGWYTDVDLTNQATAGAVITKNTTLYAKWEKAKTATSLTWSADSYTATIASPSNLFPTLKVNPEAIKGSVTYSSSHPEYATIDANGNIILKSAGETTITASYAGDEDYAADEDTYTLTVEKSDNCRWEEVTINDIEYGDEVVIAVGGTDTNGEAILYMLQDPQEAANPKVYQMNVNNLMSATNLDNTLIWNIRKRDDNNDNFTIYKKGSTTDRLAFISGYGVRVGGNNADSIFTLISEKYIQSISSNEYLRMSASSDWRHYSTNTAHSFVFYKKVCLPSNVSRVTYSVGAGDTAPEEQEVVNNTSITLPSITTNLTCVNFVGWTDAADDAAITSSNLYEAGDSYKVTQDITLKAVYAAGGGFVLVTDANDLAAGDRIVIAAAGFDVAMGADRGNNRGEVEVTKDNTDNTISTPDGIQILTLEAGTTTGTFAFSTGNDYLYAAGGTSSNHLKTTQTLDSKGSWNISISAEGIATIKSVEPTGGNARNWLRYNSTNNPPIFSCYASGQADVSIYKESVTGYTTNPECVMYNVTLCTPADGTISVDKTIVDPYGSTILTFAPAAEYMLDAVTITSGTAEVGTVSYTSNQTSGGTVKISNIQSDIEVCATFVEIPYYKVTFVDMNNGSSTQIVQQEAFGADITAPATASDGCDGGWTFVGWALSNSLTGATEEPDGLVAPGGTISGSLITDNSLTYYSVYSNSSDGTPPFSIGKSGTYYFKAITEDDEEYYATGEMYSNKYRSNQKTKIPFYVYYNTTTKKYTIKNTLTDKYVTPTYDNGWANALQEQATSFEWNILSYSNGDFTLYEETKNINSDAKTGEYLFTYLNTSVNTRAIYFGGTYFESSGLTYNKYALYLEPASEMRYYNASSCTELVTMTFDVPADAELTYENGYPEGYYKDSEKKNVSTFPTLTYEGWTFIGWTAGASYTDQIGDENLDDENSSSDSPSATIYKTGGETYYLGADVTMYPVFSKFADNEPFDMVNGGDYYIYYIADGDVATSEDEYGASNRIYAGGWGSGGTSDSYGATQSCASATLFTFTKLSNGKWSIYDNTKERYLCAGATDNNLALNTTTATYGEWTITVHNGNQVNAVSKEGYTLSVQSQDANSGTFKNYATSNFDKNSAYYHRVYVGTCTERVYSSNPSNKPKITLNGTPAVTSTKDQSIRSAKSLSLSAVKLAANGTITLTSDNADVYFSTDKTANFSKQTKPVASLTINADANGKLALTTVYVHYKPAAVPTSNLDIQTVTITATTGTDGQPNYATATTTATVRNLPTDFVIAAKWGNNWYVLPAEMNSETTAEGLLIEVDNPADPTKAIAAPNTTKYGLKAVHTSDHSADRYADYGEYLVFVENVEEKTPVANKTLYNGGDASGSKTNIQVYAQYANYYSDQNQAPRYEWIPTTTDLTDYTLTSGAILSGDAVGRTVSLDNHGIFGTLLQDKSYNGMVRLLPVDNFYGPAELQVVEWKQNSVSVMYTGAGSRATTKVGSNKESDVQLLSDKKIDHAVYSLSTADLTAATNQPLVITIKDDADATIGVIKLTIPAIVAADKATTELGVTEENAKATSIVVLSDATLTASTTKYTYNDVVVYPGGKLVIGESGKLGMYSLTLRLGSSWGAAEYEHKYPEFDLRGTYSNTSGKINLDYVTTKEQYYTFVAPFDVNTKDIKYPVDIYGNNVAAANKGSFEFQYYDGAERAAGNTGWMVVNEDPTNGATLTAHQGYTFLGMPKKINSNRQTYGIHRIPMTVAAGTAMTHETTDQTAPLSVHLCDKNNNSGWNLIGNPYMTTITGLTNNDIQVGKLVHTTDANDNWTGGWHWDEETVTNNQRFLVIPSNDGQSYEAVQASNAKLPAFKNFFVQIGNDKANALSIPRNTPASPLQAPAHHAEEVAKDVEVAIVLEQDEEHTDQMDLLINNIYTANFDRDADFTKMMNATNLNLYGVHPYDNLSFVAMDHYTAEQSVKIGYQVPMAGEYTLRISDKPYVMWDKIEALYVTDHEMSPELTTDIMSEPYRFTVTNAETNNERFTISLKLKSENQGPTTGWENIDVGKDQSIKFIHQDRLYILRDGVIYDATGQEIQTINK